MVAPTLTHTRISAEQHGSWAEEPCVGIEINGTVKSAASFSLTVDLGSI